MKITNSIELVNEDAFDFLKKVKSSSIDLILTDPPYTISKVTGFQSGNKTEFNRFKISTQFGEWDNVIIDYDTMFKEFRRVLKKGGTAVIFYDLWKLSYIYESSIQHKFKQQRFIEWIKTNPVPLNQSVNYLSNSREIALTCIKGSNPTFNSKYDNGIYEFPIEHVEDRFHPTQKPLKLMEALIQKHSNEGDVVLDCFSGSCTTGVACINTNRSFIGCELSEDFYDKSIQRLNRNIGVKRFM